MTDGAILVRDGRIADIGPASLLKIRYTDVPVEDFGQAALIPGFVDLHTHLDLSAFRGLQHDLPYMDWLAASTRNMQKMDTSDWDVSAVYGSLEALACGITCVADVTQTGASVRAAHGVGLRGVFYREVGAMERKGVDQAMERAEEDIVEWLDYTDEGLITVGIAPGHLHCCHPELLTRVAQCAIRENMPMALHVAESREEYNFVKYGSSGLSVHAGKRPGFVERPPWLPTAASPVKYVYNWGAFDAPHVLAIHCVCIDDDDVAILRDAGVSVALCPRGNALLGKGVAPLQEFLRANMRVGLGTDSSAATETIDMLIEQRVALLLERALNGREFLDSAAVLRMATLGGAEALGLSRDIGSLEVGKCADVVAIDMSGTMQGGADDPVSSLVHACSGADVLMTMVHGVKRYEKNQWHVEADVARTIARMIGVRTKLA